MQDIPIGARVFYTQNGPDDIGRVIAYKKKKGYRVRWLYGDWRDNLEWYKSGELVRL